MITKNFHIFWINFPILYFKERLRSSYGQAPHIHTMQRNPTICLPASRKISDKIADSPLPLGRYRTIMQISQIDKAKAPCQSMVF